MKSRLKWLLCPVILLLISFQYTFSQGNAAKTELPKGWHLMDMEQDGFEGISLNKAYEFVKERRLKSKQVIVAVIDSGVDTLHEELKAVLWTNPREIPGNGIDDDHNGYVDDVHGWNFIGGKDGTNVKDDSQEEARVYYKFKEKFEAKDFNPALLKGDDLYDYNMWVKAKKTIMGDDVAESAADLLILKRFLATAQKSDSILQKEMNRQEYTGNDLDSFDVTSPEAKKAKAILLYMFKADKIMDVTNKEYLSDFSEIVDRDEKKAEVKENAPKNYRHDIVKDNEDDFNDKYYGNNDIMAGDPMHGTHVSGIIAAERDNGKGMNGIADNVRIMMLRVVPNGDEHDKDIALAIRYAADNGAKVVNMSFGKHLSPYKKWVDDATRYAESKGVLLVEAAGNDDANLDSAENFPNPVFKDSKTIAPNWITVGASSDPLAEPGFKSYIASFSNYGKNEVDVFAPGTKIYSTLPGGNKYGNLSGTSMAAPVVAGIAAFIMEYYPSLTAEQVKYCIVKSATPPPGKVKKPGTEDELVNLSDISISGGVANAYQAIKLASTLNTEIKNKDLPKSTLKNKKD